MSACATESQLAVEPERRSFMTPGTSVVSESRQSLVNPPRPRSTGPRRRTWRTYVCDVQAQYLDGTSASALRRRGAGSAIKKVTAAVGLRTLGASLAPRLTAVGVRR